MLQDLKELYRYRELIVNLVIRDLKIRYKNSAIGFLWSLANPIIQAATITIIFKHVMGIRIPNYSAYLFCAYLAWGFFYYSILDSCDSIILYGGLVKKTYFPREVMPISVCISNLIHFCLAMVVFFAYVLIYLQAPVLATWLMLPVLILIQFMFHLGIAFFMSCANVFYEDVKYMAMAFLNLVFYAMPVIYPVEKVYYSEFIPTAYKDILLQFYMINPLSYLLTAYRKILLEPMNVKEFPDFALNYGYLGLAFVVSLVLCIGGYAFFNSRKWMFVEKL